ncbi:MAG: hypothetical protein ACFBWO_05525 [Paracoccaceae bacterium]
MPDIAGIGAMVEYGALAFLAVLLGVLVATGLLALRAQRHWARLAALALEHGRPLTDLDAPPLGLPEGSVRAGLAMLVVVASLAVVGGVAAANLAGGPDVAPPELIATLLGSVLGFYFGARTSGERPRRPADAPPTPVAGRTSETAPTGIPARSGRTAPPGTISTVERVVESTARVLAVAEAGGAALPPERGAGLRRATAVAGEALGAARRLMGEGRPDAALAEARLGEARADAALGGLVERAVEGLGAAGVAIGTALPAAGLALGVLRLGAGLAGAGYERWRHAMLGAPHAPALFPPEALSAQETWAFVGQVPVLAHAFRTERARGDNAFASRLRDAMLAEGDMAAVLASEDGTVREGAPGTALTPAALADGAEGFRKLVRADRLRRDAATITGVDAASIQGAVDALHARAGEDAGAAEALGQLQKLVLALDAARGIDAGAVATLVDVARRALAPEGGA